MHFALLGNHPDGLLMAQALVDTSRHELTAYSGLALPWDRLGLKPSRAIGDVEEILADPAIEAVIVASPLSQRPAQLRRALQSERHVLCVNPADETPDITYEAAMIQSDTKKVLLPILPWAVHPAVLRLRKLLPTNQPNSATLRLIEWHRSGSSQSEILQTIKNPEKEGSEHSVTALDPEFSKFEFDSGFFPGWEVLQTLGGPIAEVSAFAEHTVRRPDDPLLISGRFEKGGIFQAILTPNAAEKSWRLRLTASKIHAELDFSASGEAGLHWSDESGACHQEDFPYANPYRELVHVFEDAVKRFEHPESSREPTASESHAADSLTWQDAIRAAELDDAARRSVERRRANTIEYPEATEEAGFKGTMTLIGCGMLWVMLLLLVLARWYPVLLVVIVIMLTVFLCLQLLRAIIRKKE
jgi:predicted dehydrogenase